MRPAQKAPEKRADLVHGFRPENRIHFNEAGAKSAGKRLRVLNTTGKLSWRLALQ